MLPICFHQSQSVTKPAEPATAAFSTRRRNPIAPDFNDAADFSKPQMRRAQARFQARFACAHERFQGLKAGKTFASPRRRFVEVRRKGSSISYATAKTAIWKLRQQQCGWSLFYVNPEFPNGNPYPVPDARHISETFARRGMNEEGSVALIGGRHTFGKCHGAGGAWHVGCDPETTVMKQKGLGME